MRKNNLKAQIILLVDETTDKNLIGFRNSLVNYFDQKIVVDTTPYLGGLNKSRFMKTQLRKFITGDYLFVDSDTIICESLSDIDNIDANIAAVIDKHVLLCYHSGKEKIMASISQTGHYLTEKDYRYFNSGVMFVRDSTESYKLYEKWYKTWKDSQVNGLNIDQPALAKANAEMNYCIKELSGEWNCQILENGLKYFTNARIIHFFSSYLKDVKSPTYLFRDSSLYKEIREKQGLTEEIISMINSPKAAFNDIIYILPQDEIALVSTPLYQMIRGMFFKRKNQFFKIQNILLKIRNLIK